MTLSEQEKKQIAALEQDDSLEIEDYNRSNYQYKVHRLSEKEYRVSMYAVMCLDTAHFTSSEEIVNHIERQHVY